MNYTRLLSQLTSTGFPGQTKTGAKKTEAASAPGKNIAKRARMRVEDAATNKDYNRRHNNTKWNGGTSNENTDCGVFVKECIGDYDAKYPYSGTLSQKKYVEANPDKWELIPITEGVKPQEGDVLWKTRSGGVVTPKFMLERLGSGTRKRVHGKCAKGNPMGAA